MTTLTADPIRQALAARALLGWLAGRHPEAVAAMLGEAQGIRALGDDVRDLAGETVALAQAVLASGGES